MKRLHSLLVSGGLAALAMVALPSSAYALAITVTTLPAALIAGLTAGNVGLNIDSLVVSSNGVGNAGSVGTFNPAGGDTYGLSNGVVIASGAVVDYERAPTPAPATPPATTLRLRRRRRPFSTQSAAPPTIWTSRSC